MKQRTLLLALLLFLIIECPPVLKPVAVTATLLYWIYTFRDKSVLLVLFCIVVIFIKQYVHLVPTEGIYTVTKASAYTAVLRKGFISIRTDNSLSLLQGDKVNVSGPFTRVENRDSFYTKDRRYNASIQGIFYQVEIEQISIERKGKGLNRYLWNKVGQIENPEIRAMYRQLLFHYNDNELENSDTLEGLIYSTGTSLSLTINMIKTVLGFILYPVYAELFCILFLIWTGIESGFSCSVYRLILKRLFSNVKDRKERTGLIMLTLLLINPYYAHSLAFQIPMAYMLIGCFCKRNRLLSSLLLMFIHLYNKAIVFPFVNLVYPYFRYLFYGLQCLLYFCLVLNISLLDDIILKFYKLLNQFETGFYLNGKLSLFLLVLAFVIGCQRKNVKKHIVILIVLLVLNQFKGLFVFWNEVVFLDVGQGDSILFKPSFNLQPTLLDTGSSYQKTRVYNALNYYGIQSLDVILSHNDEDHSGNLDNIRKQYTINHLFTEKLEHICSSGIDFLGLLNEKYDDENTNSLVLYTRIGGLYYLFTGDGTKETEENIVYKYPSLHVDIFKAAHHGSNTSNSELLLKTIHPQLTVISCGDFSIYHHPSPEVLKRLKDLRIPYLSTRLHGDIRIFSLFKHNLLLTANGVYVIIEAE